MIEKLEFKNLLSFGGDEINTISFSDAGITEISGENGLGKSNLTVLLKIATYFDYAVKMTHVVNNNCAEGYLKVFYTNGKIALHKYTAKSGLVSLRVFESQDKLDNDVTIDTGGIQTTKDYLTKNEFNVPKKMFYNVYIPNIEKFKSFIGMSPQDSREIRDELFSLGLLNDKLAKVKAKISAQTTKNSSNVAKKEELERQIASLEEQIEKTAIKATEANEQQKIELSEKSVGLKKEIEENELLLEQKTKMVESLEETVKLWDEYNLSKELEENEKLVGPLNAEIESKEKMLSLDSEALDGVLVFQKNKKYKETQEKIKEEDALVVSTLEEITHKRNKLDLFSWSVMKRNIDELLEKKKIKESSFSVVDENNKIKLIRETMASRNENYGFIMASKKADERLLEVIKLGENCPTCDQCVPEQLRNQKPDIEANIEANTAKLHGMLEAHKLDEAKIKDMLKAIETHQEEIRSLDQETNLLVDNTKQLESRNPNLLSETPTEVQKDEIPNISNQIAELEKKHAERKRNKDVLNGEFATLSFTEGDFDKWAEHNESELKESIATNKKEIEAKKTELNTAKTRIEYILTKLTDRNPKKPDVPQEEASRELADAKRLVESAISGLASKKTDLKRIEEDLELANNFDVNEATAPLREVLTPNISSLNDINKELAVFEKEIERLKVLEYIFSDNGMKKYVLAKIRKGFTRQVNEDLNKFGLSAQFDDDFSVTLFKKGKEMSLISTGQKKVFDTIVCANFILLYSQKDNVKLPVIMDECMSSLRAKWAERLLRILNEKLASKGFDVKFVNHERLNVNLSKKRILLHDRGLYTGISVES